MADGHRRVGVMYLGWRSESDPPPGPLPFRERATPATLNFEQHLRRVKQAILARLYLAARHSYRGDDHARISALADLAARVGIPLVATGGVLYHAPPSPPSAGRAHLHPREMHGRRRRAFAWRPMPSGTSNRRGRWRALFAKATRRVGRSVKIADACTFSLTN